MMAIVTEMQNVADISVLIIWQSVSLDSACNNSNIDVDNDNANDNDDYFDVF